LGVQKSKLFLASPSGPEPVFEPIVGNECEIGEVDPVVVVQIARQHQGQVEDAGSVGGRVGDFAL